MTEAWRRVASEAVHEAQEAVARRPHHAGGPTISDAVRRYLGAEHVHQHQRLERESAERQEQDRPGAHLSHEAGQNVQSREGDQGRTRRTSSHDA